MFASSQSVGRVRVSRDFWQMQREAEAIWLAQAFNVWFGIIIVGTCSFAGLEVLEKLRSFDAA